MFDSPFDFFALVIAIVALVFARKAMNQVAELRQRLEAIGTTAATATAVPPPLTPFEAFEQTLPPASPGVTPEPPPIVPDVEPVAPAEAAPEAAGGAAAPPPPLPQPDRGFEETVGTRWVVWIGGLTLALGGFFMVRYSIEAGLLGPGVRTMLGGLFALALLLAGEWTRRKESISAIEATPIANIPAILTAAGTAVAFATVYAAYALYGFLVPATAFILLGLVALGTLAAALLHGPALAGLGVVGAFVTPVLVSSDKPDFWALYVYLAIVTAAAFGLARVRLWRWLAVTTIAFALLWTFPCLQCGPSMVGPHAFHVLAGFILAALLVVCGVHVRPARGRGPGRADLVRLTRGISAWRHADRAERFSCRRRDDRVRPAGGRQPVGGLAQRCRRRGRRGRRCVGVCRIRRMGRSRQCGNAGAARRPAAGHRTEPTDGSVSLHLISAAIFAAGFGVAGFLAQGRSAGPIIPVIWSAAAVFTPLALLVALYARIAHLDRSIPFAIVAVALAAAYAVATEILAKREDRPGLQASIALFATGSLAALALALTFALEKGWLTIALALMSAGTAWISTQRPIPFLRSLAAILAAIVVLRIADDPRIVGTAVGTTPIFNWLLWGYGIPALSFWAGSIFLRRGGGDDAPLRTVELAAILFTVLLAFMEIRHAVNQGDVYRQSAGLTEVALQVCVALAMAIGLERLRIRTGSVIHNAGAILLTVFAGLAAVFGLLVLENPILWYIDVGGAVINLLLLGYALPAVLALLLSYAVAGRRPVGYANTIAAGALVLALAYVTFEIRRIYHGPVLSVGPTTGAEQYTYSIAWLTFGVVLLGIGIALQLATRASGVRRRHRTHDPEGLPDRHVDADRRLPRAVVHVPRAGAGGDRLAVPAHPVPPASSGAGRPAAPTGG